jgi:hypothetical protein
MIPSSGIATNLFHSAHIYGIAPINVFNKTDLLMSENWFVLLTSDGELLPITNYDGSRGLLHKSDRIYFGHTLRYRRKVIGVDGCHFEEHEEKIKYLAKVGLNSLGRVRDKYVSYIQFNQALPDFDLLRDQNLYKESDIVEVCAVRIDLY